MTNDKQTNITDQPVWRRSIVSWNRNTWFIFRGIWAAMCIIHRVYTFSILISFWFCHLHSYVDIYFVQFYYQRFQINYSSSFFLSRSFTFHRKFQNHSISHSNTYKHLNNLIIPYYFSIVGASILENVFVGLFSFWFFLSPIQLFWYLSILGDYKWAIKWAIRLVSIRYIQMYVHIMRPDNGWSHQGLS